MQMETLMMDNGKIMLDMDKELYHLLMIKVNQQDYTLVFGKMIYLMATVHTFIPLI